MPLDVKAAHKMRLRLKWGCFKGKGSLAKDEASIQDKAATQDEVSLQDETAAEPQGFILRGGGAPRFRGQSHPLLDL